MMSRRNRDAPIADEEVTKLARRYRPESLATLISVCRDERAPASARVSAASKLLEYSDGKPGQAKPVTVADVAAMSDEQRQRHGRREYVRGPVHANSVEGFNLRVQRTVAGVFHHISPEHADLYFHEIGFRWSQRIAEGEVLRRNRHGRVKTKTLWSRVPPALQLPQVFRAA